MGGGRGHEGGTDGGREGGRERSRGRDIWREGQMEGEVMREGHMKGEGEVMREERMEGGRGHEACGLVPECSAACTHGYDRAPPTSSPCST